ncbi:hypothetical protein HZ326_21399 [Fusarium oxysporum f. sp. albedinis]|nr:hypothetical protein HZ326_21399 [Fusarium oxysporum f. sp. albedinis]
MKYNILFVSAAAELLTVKLESRSQSQLSSWWNTADFQWYGRVSLNGLSYPKDARHAVITLLLVLQSPRLILTSRYTYDTADDAQPHAKPLSMEGKIVTETVTIGRLSVENQLSSLAVTFQRNWVKAQWVLTSTASLG